MLTELEQDILRYATRDKSPLETKSISANDELAKEIINAYLPIADFLPRHIQMQQVQLANLQAQITENQTLLDLINTYKGN